MERMAMRLRRTSHRRSNYPQMKAIGWLYDQEFKYVFQNIGKDLWEDLRQEVAVIVLEYDQEKIRELEAKGNLVSLCAVRSELSLSVH